MKKKLLLLFCLPLIANAQATRTTIANGNASNPFIWDCTCFPTTNDNIVINHDVILDVNWLVNGGGSITVNASGSLIQTGIKSMLVDGSGSEYINYGVSGIDGMAYTNGASGTNTGTFSVTQALYTGVGTTYTNSGLIDGLDSLMTEGTFTTTGTLYTGNFLNTGTFNNSGHIAADSMGNTGTFNSTGGYLTLNAFGNTGTFNMNTSGWMETTQNWFNAGTFNLASGLQIYAGYDFFNGDTLGGSAFLTNDGTIEVSHNFYNGWDLNGSGNFCIANESYNSGNISGSLDICDNTGTDIDFNIGTIAGTVVFCQPGCFVELSEMDFNPSIYPNPTTDNFEISNIAESNYSIYTTEGRLIKSGFGNEVNVSEIPAGIYMINIEGMKLIPLVIEK